MAVPVRATAVRDGVVSWYREVPAPRSLAAVVACGWVAAGGWGRRMRLLPDACVDLVFDGERLRIVPPRAAPATTDVTGDARPTGLRLLPGAAGGVLAVPVHELPPGGVPVDAVWQVGESRCWQGALRAAPDPGARLAVLATLVERRLAAGRTPDPLVRRAVGRLAAGDGVAAVAEGVALSERELRRRFRREAGLGPKGLQRILRFQRFLAGADGPDGLAHLAADHGYADQAHLSRDVRRLTGRSPGALLRARAR